VSESPNPNIVDADTITGEMHPIRRAVISIGSNVGERHTNLQGAVDSLADTPEVWLTAAIVLLDTTLSARTLLERALAVEAAYGRERTGERNEPRTLDVDLIVVGDRRADEEDLSLPHPRAAERAFVLVPWHELEPEAEIPGAGPIAELLEKTGREGVALRDDIELEFR
jgi:2-amino-4-hydroxy-6-hydroxymethyldihydropteridine diphosphokinase